MSGYTVAAHVSKIDAAFARAGAVSGRQTSADLARYLCVLVSGFIEQATRHIYTEHSRTRSHPQVARFVERQLDAWTSANATKLCALTAAFDAKWSKDLETYLVGQRKDALDSVVANRHLIAHGRDTGLTYVRIKDYFDQAKDVIEYLEVQCV